jgi:hypothetical protein
LSYKMQEFFEVWNIHFLDHLTDPGFLHPYDRL